jgi:hypothetical protein
MSEMITQAEDAVVRAQQRLRFAARHTPSRKRLAPVDGASS